MQPWFSWSITFFVRKLFNMKEFFGQKVKCKPIIENVNGSWPSVKLLPINSYHFLATYRRIYCNIPSQIRMFFAYSLQSPFQFIEFWP